MKTAEIRRLACHLAGVAYDPGRALPRKPSVSRALARYLGCSESNARMMLAGLRKPNPQMIKLLEQVVI